MPTLCINIQAEQKVSMKIKLPDLCVIIYIDYGWQETPMSLVLQHDYIIWTCCTWLIEFSQSQWQITFNLMSKEDHYYKILQIFRWSLYLSMKFFLNSQYLVIDWPLKDAATVSKHVMQWFFQQIFTCCQRSCRKVMFSHVSVILFRGEVEYLWSQAWSYVTSHGGGISGIMFLGGRVGISGPMSLPGSGSGDGYTLPPGYPTTLGYPTLWIPYTPFHPEPSKVGGPTRQYVTFLSHKYNLIKF